jgi:hypothetical protein
MEGEKSVIFTGGIRKPIWMETKAAESRDIYRIYRGGFDDPPELNLRRSFEWTGSSITITWTLKTERSQPNIFCFTITSMT